MSIAKTPQLPIITNQRQAKPSFDICSNQLNLLGVCIEQHNHCYAGFSETCPYTFASSLFQPFLQKKQLLTLPIAHVLETLPLLHLLFKAGVPPTTLPLLISVRSIAIVLKNDHLECHCFMTNAQPYCHFSKKKNYQLYDHCLIPDRQHNYLYV